MKKVPPLLMVLCFVLLWFWLAMPIHPVQAADTDVRINEFMASNTTTLPDEDNDYSDWVELYNAGVDPVDLSGWYLTDSASNLTKWSFPAGTILPSNSYLIIFASNKDRISPNLHTNFALSAGGEYLGLIKPDLTIIDHYTPTYPAQTPDISYGVLAPGMVGYLSLPTPGSSNDAAVPSPAISVPSTVFTTNFSVEITAPTIPGDQIRYTTDGTEPTASSTLYSGPINITNSTRLRTRVSRGGLLGRTSYAVYVKVDPAVASFNSTLPLVVVDSFNQAVSTATDPKAVFVAVIDVGTGPLADRARVVDPADYAGFGGMRIRGSSSSGFPKKQFKLELWNDYLDTNALNHQDLNVSLLDMPAESDWILYAPGRYDRNMISNNFAQQLAQDMGMFGVRTEFVELYLNDNDLLPVATNDYEGIYVLMESVKVDENRLDIDKMGATDNADPEVTGGYVWSIDRADANQISFLLSGYSNYPQSQTSSTTSFINIISPNNNPLNPDRITAAQQTYFTNYLNTFMGVIYGPNRHDPLLGYSRYLDVPSTIDGYILDQFVMDPDALRLSHLFYKPRYGKFYNDIAWDYDRTMGSSDGRDLNPCAVISYMPTFSTNTANDANLYDFWEQLFEDKEFFIAYVDRWYELRRAGPMNTTYMYPLVDQLTAQVAGDPYTREIARWDTPANANYGPRSGTINACGNSSTNSGFNNTFAGETAHFKWWLNQRLTWLDSYYNLHPPILSSYGGEVPSGFNVTITKAGSAPAGAVIRYTLDGSDPRAVGGTVNPTSFLYSGPVSLTQSTHLKARSYHAATQTWSALAVGEFSISTPAGVPNLVISEINYNPQGDDAFEFLEFKNIGNQRIDLTGVTVSGAVTYTFEFGILDPGQHAVIVENYDAFQWLYMRFDSAWVYNGLNYVGEWSGNLSNDGELILVADKNGNPIMSINYNDTGAWPGRADNKGSALELKNPAAVPPTLADKDLYLNDGNNWRPTSEYHGSPGRDGAGPDNRVMFNEILAHTDTPLTDTIELYNSTGTPISVANWYISDDSDNYKKFRIYSGTTLAANGFVAYTAAADFNSGNGNNPVPFALSSANGDDLYLLQADSNGNLLRFVNNVEFGPTHNGESIGLLPDGQGELTRLCNLTLGQSNSTGGNSICYGPVVINEIHYNPAGTDNNLEYIELWNTGSSTESLANWQLRGEADYDFAPADELLAGEFVLVVGFDPANTALLTAFRTAYNVDPAVKIFGPWSDGGVPGALLDNGGASIRLLRPDAWEPGNPGFYPLLTEDTVTYDDVAPWPTTPDGGGPTLELHPDLLDNRFGSSWMPSWDPQGTAGRHNHFDNPVIHLSTTTSINEGHSGSTAVVVQATLAHPSGWPVTVQYQTSAGTATAGVDYQTGSGTITFTSGTTSTNVNLTVLGDTMYEADETFNLTLSAPVYGQLGTAAGTVTIVNDDGMPELNILDMVVNEGENSATITVTLSQESGVTTTAAYQTAAGTATAGEDYETATGTVVFDPSETVQTIQIPILEDNITEEDELFTITLSNPQNAVIAQGTAHITIEDNELPPTVNGVDRSVAEGAQGETTPLELVLALSHPAAFEISAGYSTINGTAVGGTHYEVTTGTVQFPAGTMTQTVTINIFGNDEDNPNHTFFVALTEVVSGTAGVSATVTIMDDEGEPTVSASNMTFNEQDEPFPLFVPLTLLPASSELVTVTYSTQAGTAVGGADYEVISGTITFLPGETGKVLELNILGDTLYEGDENFYLVLDSEAPLSNNMVMLTITENDPAPVVSITNTAGLEGDSGLTPLTFTITLSEASGITGTVNFATQDGTAVAGTDYQASSGIITFAPGQTSQTVVVLVMGNTLNQGDRAFSLVLSNFTHLTAGATTATGTITDDDEDQPPVGISVFLPVLLRP